MSTFTTFATDEDILDAVLAEGDRIREDFGLPFGDDDPGSPVQLLEVATSTAISAYRSVIEADAWSAGEVLRGKSEGIAYALYLVTGLPFELLVFAITSQAQSMINDEDSKVLEALSNVDREAHGLPPVDYEAERAAQAEDAEFDAESVGGDENPGV